MSTTPDNSALERTLHDLLFREAHLKLARMRFTPEWTAKEAEMRAVQATRTPFDLIIPSRKHDFAARLGAATDAARVLRERVALLDGCEAHVARRTEDTIEQLLRSSCPEYVQALAAQRQKEDWLRALERFGSRIFELTRALGNVRNLACSGYERHTHVYSGGALQAFGLAVEAAQAVEQEVRFANQISDAQLQLFAASGVETRALPRLPETEFSAWVGKISTLQLAEAQGEFDMLIEGTKRLYETGIAELRAQADLVQQEQDSDIHNFLLAAWEQFRADVAPEIFSGDTERVVMETAKMVEAVARASVLGRL